jgi:ubiquinone biosynthesis protein COQ4
VSEATQNPYRIQPLRALKAVRALIADKEDTAQVFEIVTSLAGRTLPKGYLKLLRTPDGGRIAYEHAELAPILDDHDSLRALPEGSVGRAYLDFVESQQLTAEGLVEASREVEDQDPDALHPYAWYGRRIRDIHDIWHVLTGYGRDALGESCVVAFTYAQTGSLGFALIALAGGREISRELPDQPVRRAIWRAYRDGKRAVWLPGEDYRALLAEPLEAARARLNIPAPTIYESIPEEARRDAMTPAARESEIAHAEAA